MSAFDDLIPKANAPQSSIRVISQSEPDPERPLNRAVKEQGLNNSQLDAQIKQLQIDAARQAALTKSEGKPIPLGFATPFEKNVGIYGVFKGSVNTFQDDFAGNTLTGGLENTAQELLGVGTPGQRDWWANFRSSDNQIRNELFGAVLTPAEQEAFKATTIDPRMDANQVRINLSRRADIVRSGLGRKAKFFQAQGYNQESIDALMGEYSKDIVPIDGGSRDEQGGDPDVVAGTNATTTTVAPPPAMQARLRDYVAKHKGNLDVQDFAAAFNFMAKETGYDGRVDPNSEQTREELKALNRGAPFGGAAPATRPLTDTEQGVNKFLLSPVGAAAVGGVNALTMNGFDNALEFMGADGNLIRRDMDATREANPISNAAGGIAASLALPFSSGAGLGRVAAEAAGYGAASAFGEADDGSFRDRLQAGLIGGAVGAGGGYAAGKLLGTGRAALDGPIGPLPPPDSAVRYKNAIDAGITNPSLGETRGGGAALIEKGLESIPGSSGRMARAAEARTAQTAAAVDNLAAKYGDGGSFLSRGDALIEGARKFISKAKGDKSVLSDGGVVGKAYDRIPISPRADASLDETRSFLTSAVGRFDDNPELAAMANDPQLQQYLRALTPNSKGDGGKLSWDSLKQFRTLVGRKMEDAVIQGNGDARDGLRGIYGALSRDMEVTAAAQGPKALKDFKFANDLFEGVQNRIEGALTKILGKTDGNPAEKAGALMDKISKGNSVTADIRSFIEIRKSMPKEEWGTVASSVYRLMGQPLNSEGRDFSAQTFLKNWGDMNETAKNLFFPKGPLRVEIDKLNDVIKGMAVQQGMGNTSGTARIASVMGMILAGPTAAAGQLATGGAMAKLWQSPEFVKWATGYTRMAKGGGGVRGAKLYSKKLDNLAKASPTLAQDIFQLRDNIMGMIEDGDEQN